MHCGNIALDLEDIPQNSRKAHEQQQLGFSELYITVLLLFRSPESHF